MLGRRDSAGCTSLRLLDAKGGTWPRRLSHARECAGEAQAAEIDCSPGAAGIAADDAKFDRLIYERVRLGIMSALAVREELTFTELKALFDVSDGNLSAHARKLEEANYLTCTKSFEDRRPRRCIGSRRSAATRCIAISTTSRR